MKKRLRDPITNEKDYQDQVAMEAYNDLLVRFRHERTGSEDTYTLYDPKFKVYKRPQPKKHSRKISVEVLKDYPIPHVDKFKTIEVVPGQSKQRRRIMRKPPRLVSLHVERLDSA